MRIIIAAMAASAFGAFAADAATLHFRTTTTSGTYQNGYPGAPAVSDKTAAFSVNIVLTSPTAFNMLDGMFTDGNADPYGKPEIATGFLGFNKSVSATSFEIHNSDFAELYLSIDPVSGTLPFVIGTYLYGGAEGEVASGSFTGVLSGVPLPSGAPMLGAGLVTLGLVGFGMKRMSGAAA